ncbi:MAG: pyridoxal phosphate-dependent aminotransferase [Caldilinea sp.]|jgi:histidinol-phosphate aminotransferase
MSPKTLEKIRSGLRAAAPVGRTLVDEALHRLQWNESPQDFPADLKEEVLRRLARVSWSRYPLGGRPWLLIDALAARVGVRPEQVVVSEGSSDLIRAVMATVVRPGDRVVMPSPTFLLYRQSVPLYEAQVVEVPLDPAAGFALPVEKLLEVACSQQARLVTVCAPNNPTGTLYSPADLRRLAEGVPGVLVIDEAYAEFCEQDLTALVELGNVILVRTFSKFYALAGVRVGYVVTAAALAVELQKMIPIFPLSVFSEIAAQVALEARERFLPLRDQVVAERERLAARLAVLPGVVVYPSAANFLLVESAFPKEQLLAHLQGQHRLLIADLAAYPELAACVRLSVGTPDQNDLLVRGFAELAGSEGGKGSAAAVHGRGEPRA